jgi:hypothetical protein
MDRDNYAECVLAVSLICGADGMRDVLSHFIDFIYDVLADSFEILVNCEVRVSPDFKAPVLKLSGAFCVVFPSFFGKVLASIDFNDESGFGVKEIYNVMANHFLVNKMDSHLFVGEKKGTPEMILFRGHVFPELHPSLFHFFADRHIEAFDLFPVIFGI